ncbi:unnamed protein product [Prorocentrum cordatum]|uniref:RRM domain-containing protein n=1 Tax=Prorocentrum cordatum TaxID=2364126 RepID=A0ABN9R6Z3_9DINO|nr:unnamed protein product [Polarella glacialis]
MEEGQAGAGMAGMTPEMQAQYMQQMYMQAQYMQAAQAQIAQAQHSQAVDPQMLAAQQAQMQQMQQHMQQIAQMQQHMQQGMAQAEMQVQPEPPPAQLQQEAGEPGQGMHAEPAFPQQADVDEDMQLDAADGPGAERQHWPVDGQQPSQDAQRAPQEATGEFGAPPPRGDEAQGAVAPSRGEAYGAYAHAPGDQGGGHEAPRGEQAYGAYVGPSAEGDQAYNPFGPSEGDRSVGAPSQGDEAHGSYRDPPPQSGEGRRGYGGPGARDEEARGGYERPSEGHGGFRRGSFGEDPQGSYAGARPHGEDAQGSYAGAWSQGDDFYAGRRGPPARGDHATEASFGGHADAWTDRFRGKRRPDDTEMNTRSYRDQPHAEERFGKGRPARNANLGRVFDGDTLLLRGLPTSVTEDVLRGCFKRSDIPVARITVCVDPETGGCKGYAFADLAEPGQTERNMQSVRGMEVAGRRIVAELYVPPAAPSSYGGKGAEYGWYGKGKDAWGCGGWGGWPGMWPSWGQGPPWAMMAKGYSAWGGKGGWGGGYGGKGGYGPGGADGWSGGDGRADPRGDWGEGPAGGGGNVPAANSSTAGSGGPDGGNLFLGGLAFRAEEKDIRELFEKNGLDVAKVTVACDRETGKSKGYAFVELRDARQGDRAVRALTGQEICGRPITVEVKGGERGPRAGPGGAERGAEDRPRDGGGDKRVFVGGVSVLCTDEVLREKFSEVGEVVGARIVTDRDTGKPKGFAFVDFATPEDAQRALRKMNNVEICGRQVRVDLPTNSKGGGKGDGPGAGPPAAGKSGGKGPKFQGLSDDRRKQLFGSVSPQRSKSRSKKRQRDASESGASPSRSRSRPKRRRRRKRKGKAASSSSS